MTAQDWTPGDAAWLETGGLIPANEAVTILGAIGVDPDGLAVYEVQFADGMIWDAYGRELRSQQ